MNHRTVSLRAFPFIFLLVLFIMNGCSGSGSSSTQGNNKAACTEDCNLANNPGTPSEEEETEPNPEPDDAFSLPKQIVILDVLEDSPDALARFDDSGTDYSTLEPQLWVNLPSLNTLDRVNLYLCMLDNLNIEDFVNQGAYLVLLDTHLCRFPTANPSIPEELIVEVTQEAEGSPRLIDIWLMGISPPGQIDPMNIRLYAEITAGVSDENPYGEWLISSSFELEEGGEVILNKTDFVSGLNEAGHYFVNYEEFGFSEERSSISQVISLSGENTGYSHYLETDPYDEYPSNFAFNQSHVLYQENENDTCHDRTSYSEHAQSVKLYSESDGSEIYSPSLDEMFFTFAYQDGAVTKFADVSSFGVGFPDVEEANIGLFLNGHEITRYSFNWSTGELIETEETYTLNIPEPESVTEWGFIDNYSLLDASAQPYELATPVIFSYAHSDANDRLGNAAFTDEQVYYYMLGEMDFYDVNIKDGVIVGDEGQYVVKASSLHLTLDEVSMDQCTSLEIAEPFVPLPTGFNHQDSIIYEVPTRPSVVSVINGVTQ